MSNSDLTGYKRLLRAIWGSGEPQDPNHVVIHEDVPPSFDELLEMSKEGRLPDEYLPWRYQMDEIGKEGNLKANILKLIDEGKARNVAEAARQLNVSPAFVYQLKHEDPDWGERIKQAKEIVADDLEIELRTAEKMAQVVSRIFLLKGIRPEVYRDNWKVIVGSEKVQGLLEELKRLGKQTEVKQLTKGEAEVNVVEDIEG